ncbi:hypothetical protein HMN09_00994800 [Mycena chlorophos]|uniref:Uncharacterized protein n=1 Tax=Mycena chlorophos TaxID=658473 RepID=A0A8H6SJM9_MYCCL|nr:hypothetical protein HMN09_00994800 [Mycena chlorophos]
MHPLLRFQLRHTFPSLFRYDDAELEWSIHSGWHPLFHRFCASLAPSRNPDAEFTQIKEKWSSLRASVRAGAARDSDRDRQNSLRNAVQAESMLVCERCGEPDGGLLAESGYLNTFCPACVDLLRADGRGVRWKERPEKVTANTCSRRGASLPATTTMHPGVTAGLATDFPSLFDPSSFPPLGVLDGRLLAALDVDVVPIISLSHDYGGISRAGRGSLAISVLGGGHRRTRSRYSHSRWWMQHRTSPCWFVIDAAEGMDARRIMAGRAT